MRSLRERVAEQTRNFSPYPRPSNPSKKGGKSLCRDRAWSARFVCLADRHQNTAPLGIAAKEELLEAGLGQKEVAVPEESTAEQFKEAIIKAFPKLQDAGGYELMRCQKHSRQLEPLSFAISQSPKLLRSVVGKSNIYIRPIQKSLGVDKSLAAEEVSCDYDHHVSTTYVLGSAAVDLHCMVA